MISTIVLLAGFIPTQNAQRTELDEIEESEFRKIDSIFGDILSVVYGLVERRFGRVSLVKRLLKKSYN